MSSRAIARVLIFLVVFPSLSFFHSHTVSRNPEASTLDVELRSAGFLTGFAQYENVTYEGDLFISGNETFSVDNSEFYMDCTITANDTSTVLIKNSRFTAISRQPAKDCIALWNQAHLIIQNSTIFFRHLENSEVAAFTVDDNASATISSSTLRGFGLVYAQDTGRIYVKDSILTRESSDEDGELATFGAATAEIENTTVNGVINFSDAAVNVTKSEIENVLASGMGLSLFTQCSITQTLRASDFADVRLIDSHVQMIAASDHAEIWLKDSSCQHIETFDTAEVSIVWRLPIIGSEVAIPYRLVTVVQVTVVLAIVTPIIAVLFICLRRRARLSKAMKELLRRASLPYL